MARAPSRRSTLTVAAGVALLAAAALARSVACGHVDYDDTIYVTENAVVSAGLSVDGVKWAFGSFRTGNWHPITWLSLMLDVTLFGRSAAAMHAVNVLIHALNAALLTILLTRMTGSLWRSAIVAGLWAVHPLRVESVTWISERKDVLAALFGLLAIHAHIAAPRRSVGRIAQVCGWMTLSLMCKPMLVTLPFLLLVLDAWPLRRMEGWGRLILEKAPLMVIAAAFSVVAVQAQSHAGAMIDTITIRPIDRVGNALESYARYLGSMAWPMDLSPIYNYPRPGLLRVLPHALGLATFTAAAWMLRRRRPAVWTGWLWYLGLLVPVIGLVQVGLQPRADRYTYLPMIGVLLAAVWLIAERWRPLALGAAAILACFWFTLSWQQSAVWNHTLSLYRHAIALAPGNPRALSGYAVAMVKDGRLQEARGWLLQAVHANPHDAQVRTNLGMVSAKLGLFDEAIEHLNMSLSIHEPAVEPHVNLGNALLFKGRIEQAMTHYRRALELRPDHANAWNNLGYALSRQGDWSGATEHYRKAASLMPDYAEPHVNLAEALHRMGNTQDAAAHLAIARRLDPDHPELDKVQRMLHAPPSPRAIIP